jgi:hypothetical protein
VSDKIAKTGCSSFYLFSKSFIRIANKSAELARAITLNALTPKSRNGLPTNKRDNAAIDNKATPKAIVRLIHIFIILCPFL